MKRIALVLLAACASAYGQHQFYGGISLNAPATPGTPAVTHTGTTGAGSYSYQIVAQYADGTLTAPSTAGTTSTGAVPLASGATNVVTGSAVVGANCYFIFRTVAGGSGPSGTTGKVQSCVLSPVWTDDGTVTGDGTSPVAAATAGTLRLPASTVLSVSGQSALSNNTLINNVTAQGVPTVTFSTTPVFALGGGDPSLTLTASVTSSTMTGMASGRKYSIRICENATGGFTFVPPTTWHGFPALVTTASACNYWIAESWDGTNLDFIAGNSH